MKYSLRILKNKNLFNRRKYPSQNALNIKYFWPLSYNHWGFLGGITELSNPQLQENCMPKKRLDAALSMGALNCTNGVKSCKASHLSLSQVLVP